MRSNVTKYYLLSTMTALNGGLVLPILVLFLADKGIGLGWFMWLTAARSIAAFVLEVPGGIVADR